ncbi:MAG: YARHG domain-containing protein [Spirochaetaceae bacterium]|nr:MAG: YARHG domain-containing protein [Spirochaetaceae bacterium]
MKYYLLKMLIKDAPQFFYLYAKVVDIAANKIIHNAKYPFSSFMLDYGSFPTFTQTFLFQYLGYGEVGRFEIERNPIEIGGYYRYEIKKSIGRFCIINNFIFNYHGDGNCYAIDPKGNMLSADDTKLLLLKWHENTWYPTLDDREFHRKLIESGKYIIVDAIYYPPAREQLYEYFKMRESTSNKETLDILKKSCLVNGISMSGDIYFQNENGTVVINQEGVIRVRIDTHGVNPLFYDPFYSKMENWEKVSAMLYAVHPNGDLYTLYAVQDKTAVIHKAEKTWGNDLIGIARNGVKSGAENDMKNKLNNLSIVELRIVHKALFALHGFTFYDYELSCYFNGYSWYKPDPAVKENPAILSPDQKRLYELIVEIEAARKRSVEQYNSLE